MEDKNPVVIARLGRDNKKRTVTFYGHYDVQPAMEREWTTDPFEMNAIDGYFYGRGTSDNKVYKPMVTPLGMSLRCSVSFCATGNSLDRDFVTLDHVTAQYWCA